MAIASTSYRIRDESSTHIKQMLHLNDRFLNGSRFSSRSFADFDDNPESSSTLLVEDFQEQFSGTGNASDLDKERYSESIALSSGTSALSAEIEPIMQGSVVSYPVSQQLSSGNEPIWPGSLGDFSSLGFNEADFWEGVRLYSQEMATPGLPPQRHGWIEGSTSCTASGHIMSNTVSTVSTERPLDQRSYTIASSEEVSAVEESNLEFPVPLQHKQSSHSPQPVATSPSEPPLIYHEPARTSELDRVLPLCSSSQAETLEMTIFPSLQPSTSQKSRFHAQTVVKERGQDSVVVEDFSDAADLLMVSGPRQHNFVQQLRQPVQCSTELHCTSENLNYLKLKQKPLGKAAPRKYGRRRKLERINLETDGIDCVPTGPLNHVQRERQRRDLMTSKVAALDRLLPKSVKRDRVAIVEDTILLLKNLERDVKDLQQRFHEAKLRRAGHRQSRELKRSSIPKSIVECNKDTKGIVIKRMGTYMKPVAICTQPARITSGKSRPTHLSAGTQCLGGSNVNKGNVVVEFRVHLDESVTVQEMILKCNCRMDYLKTMIAVVDEFQLELTTCNIMKLSGYFVCIMRLRAHTSADMRRAGVHFAVRLQSVIDVDTVSEEVKTISESIEK